ncbi:hypothetical protein FRB99_006154 [Tulasnella sp. 403]|nr:hypothetical protein FRB99_006154 [Tulasnella sp. 403]
MDITPKQEKELGVMTDQEVFRGFKSKILPSSHPLVREITGIAAKIITAANLGTVKGAPRMASPVSTNSWDSPFDVDASDFSNSALDVKPSRASEQRLRQDWEVYVINADDVPNAMVTPSGKIFVFTGIVPLAKNEDGLALVLEIAHVVLRHMGEKASGSRVILFAGILLQLFGLDFGLSRILTNLVLALPNSRVCENEADNVGLRLMAQACFNPREAPHVWERMASEEEKHSGGRWASKLDFASTHPASRKRMKTLEELLPEALSIRASASCGIDEEHNLRDEFLLIRCAMKRRELPHRGLTPGLPRFGYVTFYQQNLTDVRSTPVTYKDQMATAELATSYAALILADDGHEITADKITAITNAAGVEVEAIWATLLAKALEGKNVKDLLSNVGAGGGAPAVGGGAAPAAAAGGAAAAPVEEKKEDKKEEKEESDDDMGFGLFD